MNKFLNALVFGLMAVGFWAHQNIALAEKISLTGKFIQGGMVIGQTEPGAKIMLDTLEVPINEAGTFVLGFHRDAPESQTLRITLPNGEQIAHRMDIKQRKYEIQHIDNLDQKHVSPPKEVLERIREEAINVRKVRESLSLAEHFRYEWIWPLTGQITGVYGSQRVLNGKPSSPHYGIDIAVPEGTLVMTPAAGKVILIEDLYYSGITIMIDHGMGIMSTFLHLRESLVRLGDEIKRGDFIATSGNTGRSTGPHLDWRINWGNHARLDAALFVPNVTEN